MKNKNRTHVHCMGEELWQFSMTSSGEIAGDRHHFILDNFWEWNDEGKEILWSVFLSNPNYIDVHAKELMIKC